MPSTEHELPLNLFQKRPSLALELLRDVFDLNLPKAEVEDITLGSETFTTDPSVVRRIADMTILVGKPSAPEYAIIVESQLAKKDRKRFTWPCYITQARDRWECPTILLVITFEEKIARWCMEPIQLGHPKLTLIPLVLTQSNVPWLTDLETARQHPELAVFSAVAHADQQGIEKVLEVLPEALSQRDFETRTLYYDFVWRSLPEAAKRHLEEIMSVETYEYETPWLRASQERGKVLGEADAILTVLDTRGITVSDDVRERIMRCTDLDQVKQWLKRAVTVHKANELFT